MSEIGNRNFEFQPAAFERGLRKIQGFVNCKLAMVREMTFC